MTIDDQIRDEKLQYDINREAAKISTLSSGKIDKYEYYKGEEILPSNQKQIIEQSKFTYSPFGKTFKKQIKTIEDQGEKQVQALRDNKRELSNTNDYENKFLISKEREIFKNIYNKRLHKIEKLNREINYIDLELITESTDKKTDFSKKKVLQLFLMTLKQTK